MAGDSVAEFWVPQILLLPSGDNAYVSLGRRDGWWAAAALAVLAVTAALADRHRLAPGEAGIFRPVNDLPGFLEPAAHVVMTLGTLPGAVAIAVVVGLVTKRFWPAVAVLGAALVARAASQVVKDLVDRARPAALVDHVHLREHIDGPGYPSAHTTIAFALAIVVACCFSRIRWPVLGIALMVGLARMYMGVHLPLDVVGGAALGLLVAVPFVTGLWLLSARSREGSLT
jgi:undecaprenyl-diphosphatase